MVLDEVNERLPRDPCRVSKARLGTSRPRATNLMGLERPCHGHTRGAPLPVLSTIALPGVHIAMVLPVHFTRPTEDVAPPQPYRRRALTIDQKVAQSHAHNYDASRCRKRQTQGLAHYTSPRDELTKGLLNEDTARG